MTKDVSNHPEIRILRTGSCPSLTGKSKVSYEFGGTSETEIAVRITANTGGGFFSREWVPLTTIEQVVRGSAKQGLTSMSLRGIFTGKSVNTAGFLLAMLRYEGAIQLQPGKSRLHEAADLDGFLSGVQALMRPGSSAPVKTRGKGGVVAKKAAPRKK